MDSELDAAIQDALILLRSPYLGYEQKYFMN